ncbi:MAG TPA: CPBP family intramembrane metalloprotease [Terrimesophilobacter sp.]|nr:CPBP family intramembrane metalloprotease [Terrimesophilobacter sp.]HRP99873.1 CPBP family intramembrane metalloprotease [Terrimesophilobacter sp.]
MELILDLSLRVAPALVLVAVVFFVLPPAQVLARIGVLIAGFVVLRDAMTPVGVWSFGVEFPALFLRFVDDWFVLVSLGVMSGVVALLLLRVPELRVLVRWGDLGSWKPYLVGILGGVAVAAPFVLVGLGAPLDARGGAVAAALLPALLLMALAGNFVEELLFRGFLQSHFEGSMSSVRAAVLSGLLFAVAHIFLATTVTDLGWPVLLFVTVEGLACAFIYRRFGLVASTLTHGLAIFFLASGLL